MCSPIRCITCGAVSFASPKAALHCHTCYERVKDELAALKACHDEHYEDMLALAAEGADMLDILRTIWNQTHAEYFLPKVRGKHVWLTADELRTIAALFVKGE